MKKFKLFFNTINEQKWINEQLNNGYRLKKISLLGTYHFEKTTEQQIVQIDYQDYKSKQNYEHYHSLYNEFGWQLISGSRASGVQYWQKQVDGNDELFSDQQSKTAYYKRLMNYSAMLAGVFFIFTMSLQNSNAYSIFNLKSLYLTPGLWALEGKEFWLRFLFETPFAFMRLAGPLAFLFVVVAYTYNYYSLNKYLKEDK